MNERERWIVYPLLFLALGAALRDKLVDQTTSRNIFCQTLTVVEEEPGDGGRVRVLAEIGRAEPSTGAPSRGLLAVHGNLLVDGTINANNINAQNYAIRGVSLVAALQSMFSEFFRTLERSARAVENSNPPAPPARPEPAPATSPPPSENPPQPAESN